MIGIMSELLLPLAPWQAAHVMTFAKAGSSSGPAARGAPGPAAGAETAAARAAAKREVVMVAIPLYDSMSAQMLCRQPSARWATETLWAGVSFCSIWTTLPFSIL